MALLLPALSCRVMERPVTSWIPNSVMVTLSSATVTVFSAKIESDNGDNTCRSERTDRTGPERERERDQSCVLKRISTET